MSKKDDKIKRYRWLNADEPGRFQWINKNDISVDLGYQRDASLSLDKIRAIARNWSWPAFNTVSVAQRDGGKYFAFDGGHRVQAAWLRPDVINLPCMVFQSTSAEAEAKWFLESNIGNKPMAMVDRFKAQVMTADEQALKAKALIAQSGREISRASHPKTFSCLSSLMRCLKHTEDATERVWPLLIAICDGHSFHKNLLEAVVLLESRCPEGVSLALPPYRQRIAAIGYERLLRATAEAAAYYARGGAKVWASGVQKELNHRARTNRLDVLG
jgi:hypothetical protein